MGNTVIIEIKNINWYALHEVQVYYIYYSGTLRRLIFGHDSRVRIKTLRFSSHVYSLVLNKYIAKMKCW